MKFPETDLKNKSLKYEKKTKTNVWNLDLGQNMIE